MYARDTKNQEVFMEDIDVNDCCDDTFLPDFGTEISNMTTSGTKRKLSMDSDLGKDEGGFNDRLKRAARKSESEGNITAVVKEELRCFISAKRFSLGKTEMKVEFKEPEQHPLTPDEIKKKERRKEQNRRAATKCRRKKKDAKQVKENEMETLRSDNVNLLKEVADLKRELRHYESILHKHQSSGQCAMQSISFLPNIPTNIFDVNYPNEPDTADLYSPRSPSSFFASSNEVCTDFSSYMQDQPVTDLPTTVCDFQGYPFANNTIDLTPPVSPYIDNIRDFNDPILDSAAIGDPQLSDILRDVDFLSQN